MSALPNFIPVSVETYLAQEAIALYKSEYVDGLMVAMAGASTDHNQIASNFVYRLRPAADARGCRVWVSDCLVRVQQTRFYYPDVVVVCGRPKVEKQGTMTAVLNPGIVIEILSPSTEKRDRREKRLAYMQNPTITDILLVAQDEVYIEHYSRNEQGGWATQTYTELDNNIEIISLAAQLSLRQIYQFVFTDE